MLKVESGTYPSGQPYKTIYAGKTRIGNYEIVGGGFLPVGCRKVLASERDAQFKVVQRYVTERLKEAAEAACLYDEL